MFNFVVFISKWLMWLLVMSVFILLVDVVVSVVGELFVVDSDVLLLILLSVVCIIFCVGNSCLSFRCCVVSVKWFLSGVWLLLRCVLVVSVLFVMLNCSGLSDSMLFCSRMCVYRLVIGNCGFLISLWLVNFMFVLIVF